MDYLKIFTDFAEVIEPLSDEERGRLFSAMLSYARDGEAPELTGNERFIWPVARQGIDREAAFLKKQAENGSKGGRPKKATETQENPEKPNETQKSHKDNDNDNDKDKDNSVKEIKEKRHRYGEYGNVLLSDEELEKLRAEFPDYQQRIERLSEYIAKTGKSYKSHLATIRSWARTDRKNAPEQSEQDRRREAMKKYIKGGIGR